MKLLEVRVQHFRNIIDSGAVPVQDDVTCLVGKNESGKTAFLHALCRLNPARGNVKFSVHEDYPAWLAKKDRLRGVKLEDVVPVRAVFQLEASDLSAVSERFGPGVLTGDAVAVARTYGGRLTLDYTVDESRAVQAAVARADVPASVSGEAAGASTFTALGETVAQLKQRGAQEPDAAEAAASLDRTLHAALGKQTLDDALRDLLEARVPKIFYYSEFSRLPARVKIRELLAKQEPQVTDDEHTARSLLRLAGAENDYLLNPDYERRKRELENVANAITSDVLQYWTQNPELRVLIDINQETIRNQAGQPESVLDELKVRMWDERHWLSLPFDQRSSGFQWFFSFLVAFSQYEWSEAPIVILLDEPALGLHARAQRDYLRFIDERLSPKRQVLYTTHSPFMVQPGKLERVRIVEDRGKEHGAKVSTDVLATDPDTLFPLQGALGYDLAQHLFIAPHNLVIEGTSDYTYLSVLSDFLRDQGRAYLDPRWSLVPVGGADMIPTFVALLGHHLDVSVLVDSRREGNQRLGRIAEQGYLAGTRIVTVGEVLGQRLGDVEDLFTPDDYLLLYNQAFGTALTPSDLPGQDPIVARIERHVGARYDHGKPADALLRHRTELLPKFSAATCERFERLFTRLNATLAPPGS